MNPAERVRDGSGLRQQRAKHRAKRSHEQPDPAPRSGEWDTPKKTKNKKTIPCSTVGASFRQALCRLRPTRHPRLPTRPN